MRPPRPRSAWLAAALALAAASAGLWLVAQRREAAVPEAGAIAAAPPTAPSAAQEPEIAEASPGAEAPAAQPGFAGGGPGLDTRMPWGIVDMEEVRRALPNNLYWQTASPTENVREQQQREEDQARWNVEYGKVLSGTGTEEEVRAYYAHRQRVSADYVEFVGYLLDHYADQLPEQDIGLLELARKLHLARLEEYPRKLQESLERKRAQDEARAKWLADEAEFQGGDAEPRD
jgi:hypothetical protein